MRVKHRLCCALIAAFLCCSTLTACGAEDTVEQVASRLQAEDEHILMVKGGYPTSHPDKTYGDAFEAFFGSPTWTYFKGSSDDSDETYDVVEFMGYCTYQDVKVKALIQFTLDVEGGTFETSYLSFNEVPQSQLMLAGLIEAAFTNEELEATTNEKPDTAPVVPEKQPEPQAPRTEYEALYIQAAKRYVQAIQEGCNWDQAFDAGLNYQIITHNQTASDLGYAFMDVDGDGPDEFFLGNDGICDMYAISGGELKVIFQSGERDQYILYPDGIITNQWSSSAFESGWGYFKYADGELVPLGSFWHDGTGDKDILLFSATDFRQDDGVPGSWEELERFEKKYDGTPLEITFTPLSQLIDISEPSSGSASGEPAYDPAYPYLEEFANLYCSDPSGFYADGGDGELIYSELEYVKDDYDRWVAGTDYHYIVIDETGHLAIDYDIAEAEGIVGLW